MPKRSSAKSYLSAVLRWIVNSTWRVIHSTWRVIHWLLAPIYTWTMNWLEVSAAVRRARTKARREGIPQDCILRTWEGEITPTPGGSVAVMAHFDPEGTVSPDLENYLRSLKAEGFAVTFVSSAPVFHEKAAARLQPLCAKVMHRRNVGYDFGSYRDGLRSLGDVSTYSRLLVVNDSAHGPFEPLGPMLARCEGSADVWGMTDSAEPPRHLQSYFLLFHSRALKHPRLLQFWEDYPCPDEKIAVVQLGELGLARHIARLGLKQAALFPFEKTREAFLKRMDASGVAPRPPRAHHALGESEILWLSQRNTPLNQTHFYWFDLIDAGCPLLKRELTRANPMHIEGVEHWRERVRARFPSYGDKAYDAGNTTTVLADKGG